MLRDSQEIIRRHKKREKARAIAREMKLPRNTVTRVIDEYQAAQRRERPPWSASDSDDDVRNEHDAAEFDALVARYDSGLKAADVTEASQIPGLNNLEYFLAGAFPSGASCAGCAP